MSLLTETSIERVLQTLSLKSEVYDHIPNRGTVHELEIRWVEDSIQTFHYIHQAVYQDDEAILVRHPKRGYHLFGKGGNAHHLIDEVQYQKGLEKAKVSQCLRIYTFAPKKGIEILRKELRNF